VKVLFRTSPHPRQAKNWSIHDSCSLSSENGGTKMETNPENTGNLQDDLKQQTEEIKPEDAEKVSGGAIDAFMYFEDQK
jgi:hypothetical protein